MSWLFARHVGVGALVRYWYGTLEVAAPGRNAFEVNAGGLHVGVGARIVL